MHYERLCNDISSINQSINAVAVLSGGKIIASNIREKAPESEVPNLVLRTEIMSSLAKTNQGLLGNLDFIMMSYRKMHGFLFPLQKDTLLVSIVPPYDQVELVEKVRNLIAKSQSER